MAAELLKHIVGLPRIDSATTPNSGSYRTLTPVSTGRANIHHFSRPNLSPFARNPPPARVRCRDALVQASVKLKRNMPPELFLRFRNNKETQENRAPSGRNHWNFETVNRSLNVREEPLATCDTATGRKGLSVSDSQRHRPRGELVVAGHKSAQ